jgi:hypothetical protein
MATSIGHGKWQNEPLDLNDDFSVAYPSHKFPYNAWMTARNLLLVERSRKPGFGGTHGGERGLATIEKLNLEYIRPLYF